MSSRNLFVSTAMTREAPHRPVVKMADRPTGPAPTTATVSPGRTFPASTPTSYPVGSESARKMACSFVTCAGTAYNEVSAYGTRTDSAWVPSMRWPKIQPIPPTVWQCDGIPRWQYSQRPHFVMAGTSTRSPTPNPLTAEPTAVTVPTASWPRMRPSTTAGTSPLRMCRSVPQIVVVSIRTTMSVGSAGAGSATVSQDFWPGPWYTSAFMGEPPDREDQRRSLPDAHANSASERALTQCETDDGTRPTVIGSSGLGPAQQLAEPHASSSPAGETLPPSKTRGWHVSDRGADLRRAGRSGLRAWVPRVPPPGHHGCLVDKRQVHRRALRDPAPRQDPPVKARDDLAHLLLRTQILHRLGQPLDLLAQPERGGQELFGRHALPPQVIPQPGLAIVGLGPLGKRLARTRQVIEGTALCRLIDPLVDPGGEADLWRLAFYHADGPSWP